MSELSELRTKCGALQTELDQRRAQHDALVLATNAFAVGYLRSVLTQCEKHREDHPALTTLWDALHGVASTLETSLAVQQGLRDAKAGNFVEGPDLEADQRLADSIPEEGGPPADGTVRPTHPLSPCRWCHRPPSQPTWRHGEWQMGCENPACPAKPGSYNADSVELVRQWEALMVASLGPRDFPEPAAPGEGGS
jgi:hypothetical protein